jgi:hypothetical protein
MSIAARLKRLERAPGAGPCDGRIAVVVQDDEPIPPDAPRCPRCGDVHAQRIIEVVEAPRPEDSPP